jgi:hypothetical protein
MIFVRRHGKTEQADPSEVRMLELRSAAQKRELQIAVSWATDPQPVVSVGWSDHDAKAWAETERRSLLQDLARYSVARNALVPIFGESRSAEGYRTEVEEYLKQAIDTFPLRVIFQAIHRASEYEVRINNLTDRNFEAVRLEMTIRGPVRAYFDLDDARYDLKINDLPRRPRRYGMPSGLFGGISSYYIPQVSSVVPPPVGWIDNHSEATSIRFADRDLRPHGHMVTAGFRLVAGRDLADNEIAVAWTATAKNTDGKVEGELRLNADSEVLSAADLLTSHEPE